jgi:hypothetical protein
MASLSATNIRTLPYSTGLFSNLREVLYTFARLNEDPLATGAARGGGALAKLPFEHPGLPSGYAEGFFLRDMAQDEEPTMDEVKSSIEDLEGKLLGQKALLEKLEKEAEAEKQAEAARQAQAEEADQLEAQAKALLEQAAELKRRAGKK